MRNMAAPDTDAGIGGHSFAGDRPGCHDPVVVVVISAEHVVPEGLELFEEADIEIEETGLTCIFLGDLGGPAAESRAPGQLAVPVFTLLRGGFKDTLETAFQEIIKNIGVENRSQQDLRQFLIGFSVRIRNEARQVLYILRPGPAGDRPTNFS